MRIGRSSKGETCGKARVSHVEVAALLSSVFTVRKLADGRYEYRGANVQCHVGSVRAYKNVKLVTDRKLREDLMDGFVIRVGSSIESGQLKRLSETKSYEWKMIDAHKDLEERTGLRLSEETACNFFHLLELCQIEPKHAVAVYNLLLNINEREALTQVELEDYEIYQASYLQHSREQAIASAEREVYATPNVQIARDLAARHCWKVRKAVHNALRRFRPPTEPVKAKLISENESNPLESDFWKSVFQQSRKFTVGRWPCQYEKWHWQMAIPLSAAHTLKSCRAYAAQHQHDPFWEPASTDAGSGRQAAYSKWLSERASQAQRKPE